MAIRNVPGTYPTITAAVAAAAAGDTILVTSAYAGNEFVNVTVDSLFFNAPFNVPGITLNAGAGVTTIILSGNSSIQVNGNAGTNVLIGDAGSNRLSGMDGNDLLLGGDGSDLLIGGAGNDHIDGGAGFDVTRYEDATSAVTVNLLTGMATDGLGGTDTLVGIEAVYGGRFGDTLTLGNTGGGYTFARAGNDTITGGVSSDTIYGGSGADKIDGGEGIDTVNYFDDFGDSAGVSTKGVTVNLATGKALDNWGNGDTLVRIENVSGSSKADTITGDAQRNILRGGAGDDKINGGDGNDDLFGEDGNDTLVGGHGSNYYQSSAGNDVYNGGTGYDFSWWDKAQDFDTVDYRFGPTTGVNVDLSTGTASDGQGGTDTLKNIEQVYGSAFNDVLKGGGGEARFEAFRGGAGDDTITGSGIVNTRADYIDSTGGVTITLTGAADGLGTATGGSTGNDTLRYVNQFFGSNFNDLYDASAYTLSMPQAGGGFNHFRGGAGNDTIIGNGNTRLDFGSATTGITLDFGQSKVGDGQGGIDTFSGVNSVTATAFADILRGTAGNEGFAGQGGDDVIQGGAGNDEARYDNGTSPITIGITVDMAAGTVVGDATYVGNDTISGIEGIRGSLRDDVYVATGFAGGDQTGTFRDGVLVNVNYNRFAGLSGNDTITGNGQTSIDYRSASAGVTVTFTGQGKGTATGTTEGNDTFTGVYTVSDSAFNDVLKGSAAAAAGYWEGFNLSGGNDTVAGGGGNDFLSFSSTANAGINVVFTGVGAGKATGNGNDTFTGIEYVIGSTRDDKIVGSTGNETFVGIGGNDKLDGGGGTGDTVSYFFDGKGVTVDLTAGKALDGSGCTDTLANFENVTGSIFDDLITGKAAANLLDGLAGNDRLDGKAGADKLKGGAGTDTFAFTTALGASNVDTIADFVSGTDRIELAQSIFSALDPGTLSAAAFVQAAAATAADQHIIYNSTTGTVSYDADGKGGAAAVAFARLTPGQTLAASDFLVT
jgi:Ca2+-binding RTX toxin-like protein